MPYRVSRRDYLLRLARASLGFTALTSTSVGCGSILYPERIGQRGQGLDWKVVALDGAGLFLFFIPGLIAFAVDFYNGTIFLPEQGYAALSPENEGQLTTVHVPPQVLDQAGIERVVSDHVGQGVVLTDGAYHTRRLKSLKDFWPEAWRLKRDVPA